MNQRKKCCHCKKIKNISEFSNDSRMADGLARRCRICKHKEYLKYLQHNLDRTRRHNLKYKKIAYEILADGKEIKCCMHDEYNCCGNPYDTDYLSLDHINGNGADQKRKFKSSSSHTIYRWVINNPEEAKNTLQIVCMNFNVKKKIFNNEGKWHIAGQKYKKRGKAGRGGKL